MRVVPATALLLTLACAPEPAPSDQRSGQADAAVRSRVASYYRTFSARDWPAYRDFFWPTATLSTIWQPPGETSPRVVLTPIEDFIAQTPEGPDSKPVFEERLLTQEVTLSGNLAQVWAHYEARFGDSAEVVTWRGTDAFTWLEYEGVWRIVALAYTGDTSSPDSRD